MPTSSITSLTKNIGYILQRIVQHESSDHICISLNFEMLVYFLEMTRIGFERFLNKFLMKFATRWITNLQNKHYIWITPSGLRQNVRQNIKSFVKEVSTMRTLKLTRKFATNPHVCSKYSVLLKRYLKPNLIKIYMEYKIIIISFVCL